MAKKRPRAIVVGSFLNPAKQIWSPDAQAFATAQEAVASLGAQGSYYEDFAYELKVRQEQVPEALESIDPALAMEALIRALQMVPGLAVRPFRTYREAEAFLALIEQVAEKDRKEREAQERRLP